MKIPRPFRRSLPVLPRTLSRLRETGTLLGSGGGLVRSLSRALRTFARPGGEAGREPPSRSQAWTGVGLYALLVPFGLLGLRSRYWVTGSFLLVLGTVGAAGVFLCNLRSRLRPRTGPGGNGQDSGRPR